MKKLILIIAITTSLFSKTFIDMLNREVEIEKTPKSFIAFGPGALRLMVYLELQKDAVGIERVEQKSIKLSPYRVALGSEYIESLPIIGQGGPGKIPNLEAIIKLKPDVLIASFVDKKSADLIESKTGIPVFVISYGSGYGGAGDKLSEITSSLISLGDVFGVSKRAESIKEFVGKEQSILSKKLSTFPSVYIGGIGYKGAQGFSSTEGDYISFELLGLKNSVVDEQGHFFVQKEAIIKANPEYVFIDKIGYRIYQDEFKKDSKFFDMLQAFKSDDVYVLPPFNFYNTNLENTIINSYIISSIIEKKPFPSKDIENVLELFYPKAYKKVYKSIEQTLNK